MLKVHMSQTTQHSAVTVITHDQLKRILKPYLTNVPDGAIIDVCLRIPGGGIQVMAHWTRKDNEPEPVPKADAKGRVKAPGNLSVFEVLVPDGYTLIETVNVGDVYKVKHVERVPESGHVVGWMPVPDVSENSDPTQRL